MFYYKLLFTLTTPRSPNPFQRNFFTEKYDNPWSREDLNTNWLREPTKKRATCCKTFEKQSITKCDACPSLQYVWKRERDGTTKEQCRVWRYLVQCILWSGRWIKVRLQNSVRMRKNKNALIFCKTVCNSFRSVEVELRCYKVWQIKDCKEQSTQSQNTM